MTCLYRRVMQKFGMDSTQVPLLKHELGSAKGIVLDVGCGSDSPLTYVDKTFCRVGVDVFKPIIKIAKQLGFYDELILADARNLPFRDDSFDVSIAFEVIEHLRKAEGWKLLKDLSDMTTEKIILSTPNGNKIGIGLNIEENPYLYHSSVWSKDELEEQDFEIKGFGGLKSMNKIWTWFGKLNNRALGLLGAFIWLILSDISQVLLSKGVVDKSAHLFCVKKIKRSVKV